MGRIIFPAGMQAAWLFCAADFILSHALGNKISAFAILPVYFAAVVLNVVLVQSFRSFVWPAIINLLAVVLVFSLLPPFNMSLQFIASGNILTENSFGVFLGMAIIITTAVYWYKGFRLAATELNYYNCLGEFQFGFLILFIFFALHALAKAEGVYFTPVIVFFVCGMISLFFARRERSAAAAGFSLITNASAAGCIVLTVICGLLLAVLLNPDLVDMLYRAGRSMLVFIVNLIGQMLSFLADFIPRPETAPIPLTAAKKPQEPPALSVLFRLPESLRIWGGRMVIGLFIMVILAALLRVSSDLLVSFRKRKNKIRMNAYSLNGFHLRAVFDLVRNAAVAFMKKIQWMYVRWQGRNDDVVTIKFIYGQILRWAAMAGYRRKSSQTPDELYLQMGGWFPEAAGELSFITQQFVKVRYGEVKLSKEILQQAWESYKKIKQYKKQFFFRRRRK